jgi:hypothetical protein
MYVAGGNGVGAYDPVTGAAINASLVTGIGGYGVAVDGSGNLYTSTDITGTVAQFNAFTGAVINSSLISVAANDSAITDIHLDGSGKCSARHWAG